MSDSDANLRPDEARAFLGRLRDYLQSLMADPKEVVATVSNKARERTRNRDLEAAWVDAFILEGVHDFLSSEKERLNGKQPKDFILAESVPARSHGLTVGSPVKTPGHPFNKIIAANPDEIYARWKGGELKQPKSAFGYVCPDCALISPYRIVFECKYFRSDGQQPAKAALVEGLYEAFFYRAMPSMPNPKKHRAVWDYEYACFVAYDATPNHRLVKAWEAVRSRVEESFWNDGNIFVMMFPSDSS